MVENVAVYPYTLTLLHSERPKLYTVLVFPSGIELSQEWSDTAAGISIQVVKEHYVLTVQILCIGTDRSQQTVLKKQSDQGLRCLPFHPHLLDALMQCYVKLFYF